MGRRRRRWWWWCGPLQGVSVCAREKVHRAVSGGTDHEGLLCARRRRRRRRQALLELGFSGGDADPGVAGDSPHLDVLLAPAPGRRGEAAGVREGDVYIRDACGEMHGCVQPADRERRRAGKRVVPLRGGDGAEVGGLCRRGLRRWFFFERVVSSFLGGERGLEFVRF